MFTNITEDRAIAAIEAAIARDDVRFENGGGDEWHSEAWVIANDRSFEGIITIDCEIDRAMVTWLDRGANEGFCDYVDDSLFLRARNAHDAILDRCDN